MVRTEKVIDAIRRFNANVELRGSRDHFVGAMYDTTSPPVEGDVAIVVGINYGQQKTSSSAVESEAESIGYAKMVTRIAGGREFHTVLWNFFPYLTRYEWLNDISNAADEAERVFAHGYADPIEAFADLVAELSPELIIFHGVTSSVPVLARVALRRVGREGLLVRNLSRGYISNSAVRIA